MPSAPQGSLRIRFPRDTKGHSESMIIYGSKMYFKKNVVKHFGECEHCGRYSRKNSYQAQKFGHLYFIPLLPLGSRSQILGECVSCNMGSHIPLAQAEPMVESLNERFKQWILEIQEGKTEIVPEGETEPVSVGLLIAGTVDSLYSLGELKSIDSVSQILQDCDMAYENELVLGRWCETLGDLAQAVVHYRQAAKIRPDETAPIYQVAASLKRAGDLAGAINGLKRYLDKVPDDLGVHAELASIYEAQKDFPSIVETYDKIYALEPSLVSNKAMKKVYKKACKKSGKQGEYLAQIG
ncbi:MAG: tetratricopeptide repeat protein [Planctomycetota bacterium]